MSEENPGGAASGDLSKAATTPLPEQPPLEFYIDAMLKGSTALRSSLRFDENMFRTHAPSAAPRGFVLWTILDEVDKTAMSLMRLRDLFADGDGEPVPRRGDCIERTGDALVLEDLALRQRRLSEVLVTTVLFASTDEEAYYRHYLLLEEFERLRYQNWDRAHYHGAASIGIGRRIDALLDDVRSVERSVDMRRAWYANYGRTLRRDAQRPQTSASSRLKRALPLMTDFERFTIGTTYEEAFRRPSAAIHFTPGAKRGRELDGLPGEGTQLGLLGLAVLVRLYGMLGRPADARLEQLANVMPGTDAPKWLEQLNVRDSIRIGDFVVAFGFVGEVVEERRTKYGYRSLRIEFLAEQPQPGLASDWFLIRDVARIFSREQLEQGVQRLVGRAPDQEACRAAVLDAWNRGLRDAILRRARRRGTPERSL